MRVAVSAALLVPLVLAHDGPHLHRRQSPVQSPSVSVAGSAAVVTPGAPGTPTPTPSASGSVPAASGSSASLVSGSSALPNGTISANATSALPTFPVSLASTNPTAIPLSFITAAMSTSATIALPTTFAPGSTPTAIPGAPPLPDANALIPSNYPPLDHPPPIDSPEVLQWKQDVANSGITIPTFAPTVANASCAGNLDAVADTTRCWWTCTGCVRDTDVTACPDQLTWGLTYDDGPGFYTPNLLAYLDAQDLKSTFFSIGSRALEAKFTLQTEYMSGHQIGVHTWSHPPLTTLTNDEIIAELGWTKKVIKDITGLTPNTMRPPYGDIDDRVRAISLAMGLTPVIWTRLSPQVTFDTGDFNIAGGTISVSQVLNNFENIVNNATSISTGFIVLEHDLFEQTVDVATGYILPDALAHNPKLTLKPVFECLGKTLADAYIETNDNKTYPPPNMLGSNATGSNPAGNSSDSGSGSSSGSGSGSGTSAAPAQLASGLVGFTALIGAVAAVMMW